MAEYVFRAYLNYDVRPSDQWTTTLEYPIEEEIDGPLVLNAADTMAAGLQSIHFDNVLIDRIVVSTWEADSDIYDPGTVRTISYGEFGVRSFFLSDPAADDLTLFIRKSVDEGRTGKMNLRGVLALSNIETESGEWAIIPADYADFQDLVDAFYLLVSDYVTPALIGAPLIDTIYPATAEGVKQMPVKVYGDVPNIRNVSGFVMVGPRTRQVSQ